MIRKLFCFLGLHDWITFRVKGINADFKECLHCRVLKRNGD